MFHFPVLSRVHKFVMDRFLWKFFVFLTTESKDSQEAIRPKRLLLGQRCTLLFRRYQFDVWAVPNLSAAPLMFSYWLGTIMPWNKPGLSPNPGTIKVQCSKFSIIYKNIRYGFPCVPRKTLRCSGSARLILKISN